MFGAIIGDISGSTREFRQDKSFPIELFPAGSHITDDTILTIATMDALLHQNENTSYGQLYADYTNRYKGNQYSYGERFLRWAQWSKNGKLSPPYNSLGNGSAMRVSPIGWVFETIKETREEAILTALPTHNHPEGIKGAEAVASAVYLARTGSSKSEIKNYLMQEFNYRLNQTYSEVRENSYFIETCPESIEESIIAFLSSESFEDAIYKAIALGGDADTQACITGAIAEAFYKPKIDNYPLNVFLPKELQKIVNEFKNFYIQKN